MTVDRFSLTNILEMKRKRLFAAMTREERRHERLR
jgi:hypothetical protein